MSITKAKPVAVIIVTYNSGCHIQRCLKSIDRWGKDVVREIIIIDNNSSDETAKRALEVDDRKIKIIHRKSNRGFASSVNLGIKISRSKYVLLLNPDTRVYKNSLQKLLKYAEKEGVGIVGGLMVGKNRVVHKTYVRKPGLLIGLFDFTNLRKVFPDNPWHKEFYYLGEGINSSAREVDAVSGGYMLVKREVAKRVGLFDDRFFMYLEDVDFCLKVKGQGLKVIYAPKSVIFHEGGASSNNKDKINFGAWVNSRKVYFQKNHNWLVNMIVQPAFLLDELIMRAWRNIR